MPLRQDQLRRNLAAAAAAAAAAARAVPVIASVGQERPSQPASRFQAGDLQLSGTPLACQSSEHGRRQFRGACGTGLFYRHAEFLARTVDVQSGTWDDASAHAPLRPHDEEGPGCMG
ncbi:hypothetical protein RM533_06815 [Croceicoccus sp. F390]|uniref:Secreted protein n=1 Tax=Croceicoccus esteveae TaxID=3075597 RepID=A0ABU2ZH18_9SPHN|nr:hypothetical protein [Croceicoccus sp. F390]MDT0575893.1 hypothetical protein [Croceicoccus sp. F390]